MAVTPGTRLGVYEITAQIGVGGMGEVYRATDTNLKRQVAVRVLPASVAGDPDRLARFQREAEVLASLNHPNIAAIYGFEKLAGVRFLVMELVEGDDLSQRIARGAVPLGEALPIAKQIALGLEAAHEQGVVHRDLKPANIKVRADGTVKVLDFGLAKASETSNASADVANAQTVTSPAMMTGAGIILGTAAYMSPEQARGKPVDRQTDIWAFGCVLYEMLTGRTAFSGETVSDTIAKVLEREPDWQPLASIPVRIRELLRRCLEKQPSRRPHDIADARIEIEDALRAQRKPRRAMAWPVAATGVMLVITLLAGVWRYAQRSTAPVRHELVSVLIADFHNSTGDPIFDGALEPLLRITLEGARFIRAYDRNRVRTTFGVSPPATLDDATAREFAVKQGVGLVLAGAIDRRADGYEISVKAVQALTGEVIARAKSRASNRDEVLVVATQLVTTIRNALGDETSDSANVLAMKSLSTTSMEVARLYAVAVAAQSDGRFEDARQAFLKAVERDPNFGLGYQGVAIMSSNLGKLQDADKYAAAALRHLDGVTERERFAIRASYYMNTGDYRQCVKEYGDLIAQYAADAVAHNNRGVCLAALRKMGEAVDEMRQAVRILPNRVPFRANLAIHSDYAGDFQGAEREVRGLQQPTDLATLALAFAELGQGLLPEARATYEKLAMMGARGTSWAAAGMGDLALYEGRFSEAARLFEQSTTSELASKNRDRAARRLTSLAYAHITRGQKSAAVAAAEKALLTSDTQPIRFLSARIFVEADAVGRARRLAASLSAELAAEPQAYGKLVEGEIALKNGDPRLAIKILTDAGEVLDTWLGHFDLGRAYLALRAFPQADSEFDRCITRRGEALSLLVDEEPTSGYFPMVYYYQGLVREGLKDAGFANSYRAYLNIRGKSTEDPLVAEARRRVGH